MVVLGLKWLNNKKKKVIAFTVKKKQKTDLNFLVS